MRTLGSEEKVIRFAQWVNEIHDLGSWALGADGFFLDDVKIVLRKSLGVRRDGQFDHGGALGGGWWMMMLFMIRRSGDDDGLRQ